MSLSDLATLDSFLADKSYVEGFVLSHGDQVVYNALGKAPADNFVNAARWYRHVTAQLAAGTPLAGEKKDISAYGEGSAAASGADGGDDFDEDDLFDSDDEADAEAERIMSEKAAKANAERIAKAKAKGKDLTAKSSVLLDIKPWDDETDMAALEGEVRKITQDGLLWGASKLVDIGYGIKKLQMLMTIEDEKVSVDDLQEKIEGMDDYVQSTDIAAFNKI